jgi:hypothetical protein
MAHYAFLDEKNIVTEVIVGKDETDTTHDWEEYYGLVRGQVCKRCSYSGSIRKNYPGIGYTYDVDRDAFIPPRPDDAIGFDEATCRWIRPEGAFP